MILAFDIGNTNIKVAIIEDEKITHQWRLSTDPKRTGDEYFSALRPLFIDAGIDFSKIEDAVISAVVPALIGPFIIVTQHFCGKKPLIIGPEIYSKLPVKIPETAVHEIGTDLLSDAVAAWEKYKTPAIVIDFGTALSFTAVDHKGNIAGIAIAPGLGTAINSLFKNTAQLPSVPMEVPESSLGKNTVWAIQSGIFLGYKGLVESMVSKMKTDLSKESMTKKEDIKVIATGGLNSMLQPITKCFNFIDKDLTITGMLMILKAVRK